MKTKVIWITSWLCSMAMIMALGNLYAAAAEPSSPPLPLEQRMYLAGRIYASALANFAFWQNVPGLNVDAAYRAYLKKAIAAEDRAAFTEASMEFLASFHNAHTVFFDLPLAQRDVLPFHAQLLDGQWVVTESRAAGLKPGDVIEKIDGRPFSDFVQSCMKLVSASTEPGARHLLFGITPMFTPYAHLFPEQFVLTMRGGKTVPIDRRGVAVPKLATEGRWLEPGRVAYIRIPSFMGADFEKRALELAHEYHEARLLIIDVRGNAGGSTPSDLTAYLMNQPYRWWAEAAPLQVPFFRFRATQGHGDLGVFDHSDIVWPSTTAEPPKENFPGKLAMLVDAGCMSACEDFVMPFKDNHRAMVMGETTSGSSGQPYMLDLGNGMMMFIGAKRELFPDGSRFEGVGIQPDIEICLTADDLARGTDTVLEAARKQIAK